MRKRTDEELRSLENEAGERLFKARIKNAVNQLDDSSAIAKARRERARVKTLRHERTMGINTEQAHGKDKEE